MPEYIKGKPVKYNADDPDAWFNERNKGWLMHYGKVRRAWFLDCLKERGRVRINAVGGLSRNDPDLKKLEKKGLVRFIRENVGGNTRRTFVELNKGKNNG